MHQRTETSRARTIDPFWLNGWQYDRSALLHFPPTDDPV
jgi:hypothetical protein